jgi:hypothetical protein
MRLLGKLPDTCYTMWEESYRMKHLARPADLLILTLSILSIALVSIQVYSRPVSNPVVRIEAESQWIYALDQSNTAQIPGPNGIMEVLIRGGEAFVEDCDCCPLKICVSMGRIHRAGQWIICLPNQIFVWIEGTPSDTSIDDIAS